MIVDKNYCMSSFLMFRTIADRNKCFMEGWEPVFFHDDSFKIAIHNSNELENAIASYMKEWTKDGKAALALSGGIDSAILAKYMPKGSKAYTFQCVIPGVEVTNEVPQAAKYANECELDHEVVEVYWSDVQKYAPILMEHKRLPFHSIEIQIYKAALKAKADGFDRLIFGETSDLNYGGMDKLMAKDWTIGEFIERYSYIMPYKVLREGQVISTPFYDFEKDGYADVHEFLRNFTLKSSMGSYVNACSTAGIEIKTPYVHTKLNVPLDYNKVRNGNSKYIVREIFNRLYNNMDIPEKLAMPRPMAEWLKDWEGPVRKEFFPNCIKNMDGDQKWLVYILEKFLNLIEECAS